MDFRRSGLIWLLGMMASALSGLAQADAEAGEKKAQLCLLCHKAGTFVPQVQGQQRDYIEAQLKAYKDKRRSAYSMQANTAALNPRDMRDLADYFASQPWIPPTGRPDPEKAASGKATAAGLDCASCHQSDYSGQKEVPRLAGMEPGYLASELSAMQAGRRQHPAGPGLKSMTPGEVENLAHYFAQLP